MKYTSAKIVLVGESNVGKSCLAMRLAEGRYPEAHEQGTTHGMRFWTMAPERLDPTATAPPGERRDVVLWDMGGQDEYRLVHQLFLHDTTLALVFLDPTRGRTAREEVESWNKRLEKQLHGRRAVKLLVGAKMDNPSDVVDTAAIERLRMELGFAAYVETSALTGRGIEELRHVIADALDWDALGTTSRPELFQRIRDEIAARRSQGDLVLRASELKAAIRQSESEEFAEGAVEAVIMQLDAQRVIAEAKLASGALLVVQLPVIEGYAGALLVAARNNPRGVPAIEERALASRSMHLPGVKARLPWEQESAVLRRVVELLIAHDICFRHQGLLIFPTLFPEEDKKQLEQLPHSVSLYYDFTGAIDNIYASLVVRLAISGYFGAARLWPNRAEFDEPGAGLCGIRQIKRPGGLAHADLYFAEETTAERRTFFTRFVEDHLWHEGIEVQEHQAIKCHSCGYEISEEIVQARIAKEEADAICPICGTRTLISVGVDTILERDPESDLKIFALRRQIEQRAQEDAKQVVQAIGRNGPTNASQTTEPVRILHLSDLHFTGETSVSARLQPLLDDVHKGEALGFETLDYLVISGDMTDRGSAEGLKKAREFVTELVKVFGLSAQRCIFVPGNHDVQDLQTSYEWRSTAEGLKPDQYVQQGNIFLVRNDKRYPRRLKQFSDGFFHKILQQPYPLDYAQQGMAYLFPDTRLQFLALNSCWQIDQFHRKRAAVHPEAVAQAIEEAGRQVKEAVARGELEPGATILRLGVWHHAIAGQELMQTTDFIGHLQNNGVKLGLHGDIHELRRALVGYWDARRLMFIVGAGSFASPPEGRPESTPRLYNLLEVRHDLSSVRVHTRAQPRPDGPWEGWYKWLPPDGGTSRLPYYDIDLA